MAKLHTTRDPLVLTAVRVSKDALASAFRWRDASGNTGASSHAKLVRWIKVDGHSVIIETGRDANEVGVNGRGRLHVRGTEDAILALPRC